MGGGQISKGTETRKGKESLSFEMWDNRLTDGRTHSLFIRTRRLQPAGGDNPNPWGWLAGGPPPIWVYATSYELGTGEQGAPKLPLSTFVKVAQLVHQPPTIGTTTQSTHVES